MENVKALGNTGELGRLFFSPLSPFRLRLGYITDKLRLKQLQDKLMILPLRQEQLDQGNCSPLPALEVPAVYL
jgi:hypothetical protein